MCQNQIDLFQARSGSTQSDKGVPASKRRDRRQAEPCTETPEPGVHFRTVSGRTGLIRALEDRLRGIV